MTCPIQGKCFAGIRHPAVTGYTFVAADGVEMPLEEGTSAFITMNPGYIGRAELPESLKVKNTVQWAFSAGFPT